MNQPEDQQRRIGKLMVGAMWLLLLGLLTLFFTDFLDKQYNPNQQIASVQRDGQQEIELQRNKYGHYVASGMINQQPVVFMLDTGASDISIPQQVAQRLDCKRVVPFPIRQPMVPPSITPRDWTRSAWVILPFTISLLPSIPTSITQMSC